MSESIKKTSQERPSQAPVYETYDLLHRPGPITQTKADLVSLSPDAILRLQRTLGNRRIQRLIAQQQSNLPSPRTKPNLHQKEDETDAASVVPLTTAFDPEAKKAHHEATLRSGNVQFRIPEFEQISQAYMDEDHAIPQDTIKNRVRWLLMRMNSENRLKKSVNHHDIGDMVEKIFPQRGGINKVAFEKYVDTSDRSRIYKSVFEAISQVKPEDRPKFLQLVSESIVLVANAIQNSDGLVAVFGSKSEEAKETYTEAQKKLKEILGNLDQYITTDYNGDSKEVGIGGGTSFERQKIHLALDVVQCKDENQTKWTLIHEACHLAKASVLDDGGYYGSAGFEAISDTEKVNNAAHYEELPKRELGISSYLGQTFRERADKTDNPPLDDKEKMKLEASEYLRKAWTTAAQIYEFMRDFWLIYDKDKLIGFGTKQELAENISKMLRLSIHEQKTGKKHVTMLDVAGAESVAHAVDVMRVKVASVSSGGSAVEIVKQARAECDLLFLDENDDMLVLDWLNRCYGKIPKVTKATVFPGR